MSTPAWQFASRFRRHAFGWRSDTPIQRLKEALTEIKAVARKDPVRAAEGAVLLLEKLSPALEQVDGSSGAIGTAVNRAIETLVPIIASADVEPRTRQRWLDRLWEAMLDDDIPYIELLGEHWGELCGGSPLAARWVDELLPVVERIWDPRDGGHGYFKGTSACLSCLLVAGAHDRLLDLLERAPLKWWHDRKWGVRALVAMGRKAEALQYAEQSRGLNDPPGPIARACESILLSSGLAEEAYRRYAIEANQATTHLATFRAIAKKYPQVPPEQILRDLVASTPGSEGKWFASAKDAGFYDLAIDVANTSPTDPRTLARAARDFGKTEPKFAVSAGLASLRWIALGYGYEITGADVDDCVSALLQAASELEADRARVISQIRQVLASSNPAAPASKMIEAALERRVGV